MIRDEQGYSFKFDAWNRLVDNEQGERYRLDALGRRDRVQYTSADIQTSTRELYYDANWQLVEEQTVSGTGDDLQYVWSPLYIDGLALRYRDTDGDHTFDEAMFVLCDA